MSSEEKDLECTNRLMVVIRKSLTKTRNAQLKMGIVFSSKSNRLYALIENTKGGLYRSDDAGEHWELINEDKNLWQRPWYYMNLQADPKNENGLIVLNVNSWKRVMAVKALKK
jgi:hypothetical protein